MNICVFCASSDGVSEAFKEEARVIGRFIATGGHTLVYGGATGGLMDAVAETVAEQQGEIIGVVPELIVEKGRRSTLPMQLFEVADMSERKEMMKELADVFVVLPGGFGTYDELFDVLASGMVGYHDKPLALVNTDDFYAGIKQQIRRMTTENVGYVSRTSGFFVHNSAAETIAWLASFAAAHDNDR